MSNHSGSYMLNEIIVLMGKYKIFENLGKDETYALVRDIIEISSNYDCNRGEILDGIGRELGICYSCMKQNKIFKDGLCSECRKPKPKPQRTQSHSEKA